jgi:predicted NBD/HSP70 family sugar kinase
MAEDGTSRGHAADAAGVYAAAKSGNTTAIGIFRDMGRYLDSVLQAWSNVLNPELIVIGGALPGMDLFMTHSAPRSRPARLVIPAVESA